MEEERGGDRREAPVGVLQALFTGTEKGGRRGRGERPWMEVVACSVIARGGLGEDEEEAFPNP